MAKSALRIRFVINAQGGATREREGRQRFANEFTQTIIQNFAFRYADDTYKDYVNRIQTQLQRDIRKELVHMAALFRAHITGAPAGADGPAGKLTTVAEDDRFGYPLSIRSTMTPWAARSKQYLSEMKGDKKWFSRSGLMRESGTADNWINTFGPIRVTFKRDKASSAAANVPGSAAPSTFKVSSASHVRIAVGTISVFALTHITPAMLPGLASADPEVPLPASRNDALIGLFGDRTPLAYRFGRLSSKESGQRYRPTLEPFLTYFLTNAVPAAVRSRLRDGTIAAGRSSGGRTRR
jgi:hypothetical protein